MKLNKKQLLKYGGLVLVSLILLPLAPLIIGLFIAFKLFKSASTKKRGAVLAIVTILISLVATGVLASKLPASKPKTEVTTSASQTASPTPIASITPTSSPESSNKIKAKVVKVVDGDTMDFSFGGKTERIRVIGINTPETVDPRKSVECFGVEASNKAKELLKIGAEVELEADPTQGDRDKYQRLLRYVWFNNEDFGKKMIAEGYAFEYTYNTPYKYQSIYKEAQKEADINNRGLWADNACVAISTPKPATPKPATTSGFSGTYTGSFSCSGPDRDCSDFSTHAQAQSFFNSCGFTATNDPMKLDSVGVGDGVACESLP
ncbi:MAG: hypothetical protein ACD_19C00426G0120 [uncultured bacterium]|nr:MAG: hypothetical protein ACD_19C00426G0120 [uncultured bacterium]